MKKKLFIVLTILLILSGAITTVLHKEKQVAALSKPETAPYVFNGVKAYKGSMTNYLSFQGEFQSDNEAQVKTKLTGNILSILEEGTTFKKGDVLVKLDDREIADGINVLEFNKAALINEMEGLQTIVSAQKIQMENALKNYERNKTLFQSGALSGQALDNAQNLYQQAQSSYQDINTKLNVYQQKINSLNSQISQQKNLLSYTTILAPFDGVVAKKLLNTGELAGSTSPILQISGLGGYKVMVKVPVQVAAQINLQDDTLLTYGEQVVRAQIDKVLPAGENNLSVIELRLPNNTFQVPVHTFLQVQIPTGAQQNGIIIPVEAKFKNADNNTFAVKEVNGLAVIIPVKVLVENNQNACVEGNIQSGDTLVIGYESKLLNLPANTRIKVVLKNDNK
ncbi:efflux transporter, RND family, MFP subunit [Desulfofarcimen acetoxidans DSM 771]|jgi:RND family efflux transporter MFP subunit|uniref:Efflux transporter, RND family, MFP subunit n=1 Tax=Desulfofarcimen acetoxidans (strain ATCC 49208 / DSM 771 / KCTC 5769 / VKM B-1644 / 5575) TaxID=485916 RepID=C8W5Y6_DESAS|nr:efflux RND transporter periplasmic adaptor subunit [Desulfofarcimen acetoxidans]ACV61441.1 efflux transporter, RND family, MFP subunit [Desulfofarcimen acetoxidans DSM 771]